MKSGDTMALSVQGSSGLIMPVSISFPADASTQDLVISVSSVAPTLEPLPGFVAIQITAMTNDKVAITQFDQPLLINLGKLDLQAAIAYSSDGSTWNDIAKLEGDQLPAASGEGYFIAVNGDVIILTRHLTSFGTKIKPIALKVTTTEAKLTLNEVFSLDVSGIQGAGKIQFESTSPKVCYVTQKGKVIPHGTGECHVAVAVSASGNFMDAYSTPTKFIIEDAVFASSSAQPVSVSIKQRTKLIGSVYFNRNSSALNQKAFVALAKVLASLKSYKNYTIKLVGHSDGTKGLNNQAISLARSKTVAGFLKKNKTSGKIAIEGLAAKELVASVRANDALNRRVEVWVIATDN
jgi:outer membrane protein OmpA-like peptidoglycan-associated protein